MNKKLDKKTVLSRRKLLGGMGALSGFLLTGCDTDLYRPPVIRGGLMGVADVMTMASQRLLLSKQQLVKEFDASRITNNFPVWNASSPEDELHDQLRRQDYNQWDLPVTGLVNNPTSLSLNQLKRIPSRTQVTMHICEQGWSAIAEWTGVPLLSVIEAAGGMQSGARYVVISTYGGWYAGFDMFDVVHPQTILAYGMNGKELPFGNGAPLRLRVERQCGYKQLKWIKSIEVVSSMDDFGLGTGGRVSDFGFHWYAGA